MKTATMLPSFLLVMAVLTGTAQAVDYAALLARHDVIYRIAVERGDDGMPIGNGDLGTMAWTPASEGGLAFQLNKADVFSGGRESGIYWANNTAVSCGRVLVKPASALQSGAKEFEQRLVLHDGLVRVRAVHSKGAVSAVTFVDAVRPVLVVAMDDTRPTAGPVTAVMTLWRIRPDRSDSGARYVLTNDCAVLVQEFKSDRYFLRYAMAAGGIAASVRPAQDEPQTAYVTLTPDRRGRSVALIAVAVSRDPNEDTTARALAELAAARERGYDGLLAEHTAWWHAFWERTGTFVTLKSGDGAAEYIENLWYLNLYQTASSSRGAVPPKFNGSLWVTDRDSRNWGGQYWIWNTQTIFFPLFAQNAIELVEPLYRMYWAQLPAAKDAARQRWGVGGAHYPEVSHFDGAVPLTEEQARQVREWNLGRPVEITADTRKVAGSDGTMTHIGAYVPPVRYSHPSHIFSSGSELAMLFWRRYAYTGDRVWLKDRVYPFMKEVAQFYLEYFKKGADGLYHIERANVHENCWGARDGIMDLAAVRAIFPRLIEASRTLDVDAPLRPRWQEMLDNLAPYPTAEMPEAQKLAGVPPGTFAFGLLGDVPGQQNGAEENRVTPVFPFEDIAVSTSPTQLVERARATLRSEYSWGGWGGVMNNAGAIAWSRVPIIAARLGMKDDMKEILTKHSICSHVYPMTPDFDNELGIVRFEYGAIVIAALNEALLQSHHGLIQVFPAWPDGWDARFKLLAEGNVLVEAERKGSNITFVALQSIPGGPVTLLNPWPGRAVRVSDEPGLIQGDRLTFNAGRGVTHVLSPVDRRVKRVPKMTLLPRASDIKSIRFVKGDKTYQAHLGLDQADLPANPEVKLPVGPLAFSSPADVSNRFISGWYQDALPQCMTWSEKYEGSLMLTGMTGRVEQVNATFIGAAGKSAFGNVVMEADFMSEKTSVFGFFVRQQEKMHSSGWRHSIESYRAVLSFASPTDAWIRFGGPDASLDVKAVGPLKVAYVEGQPYRLRLTVRNLPGKPVRYASFKLEVFAPGQAQAVSGEWVANLTADNRPNCGEIGIYMKPNTGKDVDGRLYVRRFTIREAGF